MIEGVVSDKHLDGGGSSPPPGGDSGPAPVPVKDHALVGAHGAVHGRGVEGGVFVLYRHVVLAAAEVPLVNHAADAEGACRHGVLGAGHASGHSGIGCVAATSEVSCTGGGCLQALEIMTKSDIYVMFGRALNALSQVVASLLASAHLPDQHLAPIDVKK